MTLLIDYDFDNGFFNTAEKKAAIESVANEIGSRLNDSLAFVRKAEYSVVDPRTFTPTKWTFDVPANAIRIFVSGSPLAGFTVGQGGARWSTGLRDFTSTNDFAPYVGYVGFDNDGSTNWDFSSSGSGTSFQTVARHELLHVLGIGIAPSWNAQVKDGLFVGLATIAANGGAKPAVNGGHFAQGTNSIMAPVISSISHPTAIDWAALDDIGWDVSVPATPGQFADVVGRTANGHWWISSNTGGGLLSPTVAGHWSPLAGWRDVRYGDFNGDGLTDLVGRTSGGAWWVGYNNGGSFVNRYMGFWSERVGWQNVTVGDFNGDGSDDVAGQTATGAWYVARSLGTSFLTTWWAGWSVAAGWHDVRVGDFNGDGRDDLAARNKFGSWWVARSTTSPSGGAFVSTHWAGWNEGAGWRDVLVADFDGNGTDDIAARNRSGGWYVALSVGSRFSTGWWTSWTEAAGWRDVAIGDFYGDGRPDIIGRTFTGAWYLAVNLGASFNTLLTPFGQWSEEAGWRDVQVGQFVGSSKADILARTTTGAWYIGANSGGGITFTPFGQWNEGLVWQNVGSRRDFVVPVAGASALSAMTIGATTEALPLVPQMAPVVTDSVEAATFPGAAASLEGAALTYKGAKQPPNDDNQNASSEEPTAPVIAPIEPKLLDDLFAEGELLLAFAT